MVFTFQPPFSAGLSGYVAELASSYLCAALSIVPTVRHADYLGSWLNVLRADNRAIFKAASQASKAADRSEEHTSELQSLMRNSYAVFCLKKKKKKYYTIVIIKHITH